MATEMISIVLPGDEEWTLVAPAPIANILLLSAPQGYEIYIGDVSPLAEMDGMPVTASDGTWTSSSLEPEDAVYARPFGAYAGQPITIKGMVN